MKKIYAGRWAWSKFKSILKVFNSGEEMLIFQISVPRIPLIVNSSSTRQRVKSFLIEASLGYITEAQRTLRLGKHPVVGKFEQVIQWVDLENNKCYANEKTVRQQKGHCINPKHYNRKMKFNNIMLNDTANRAVNTTEILSQNWSVGEKESYKKRIFGCLLSHEGKLHDQQMS